MALKAFCSPLIQPPMLRFYSSRAALKGAKVGIMQKEAPKCSKLSNGMVVASVENNHPITRIALAVKAGSRYEGYYNLGVSHSLRNCCGLSNTKFTIFGTTRNLELMGATVTCSNTREYLIYTMEVNRDDIKQALKYFIPLVCDQIFHPWEVRDYESRMKVEIADYLQRPNVMVSEALHNVAFRTGLGNSVYTPEYMFGRFNTDMLTKYFKSTFSTDRMAFAAVGMNHESACEYAQYFRYPGAATVSNPDTKYGGGEKRIEKLSPYSHVMIAAQATGLKDPKDSLSALVLQQILGTFSNIKRGASHSKLFTAAAKVTENPFAVTCLNLNYSDSGLFGFYVIGQPSDMPKLVKILVETVGTVKVGATQQDVDAGKIKAKAALHLSMENSTDLVHELACQAFQHGRVYDIPELDAMIDSIKVEDVNKVAKKITNGKPSMAAVGNLVNTPYLDQIR